MPGPRDQLYHFRDLDIHAAIAIQNSLEKRKTDISAPESELMQKGDKIIKLVIQEIDQMYDDLDRHISAQVRIQEEKKAQENR
jgi:septation ring formation regulator EzrA